MRYLRVKNWETYQHYKDRSPPWIKLHRALLDDYEFSQLPDAAKAHLLLIGLLASHNDGRVPADPQHIAGKIGARDLPDLDLLERSGWLIAMEPKQGAPTTDGDMEHGASKTLAKSEHDASSPLGNCQQAASGVLAFARSREERTKATEAETEESARGRATIPQPNDSHRQIAKELGLNVEAEFAAFVDHDRDTGKRHRDAAAAFRNWLRNSAKWRDQRRAGKARNSGQEYSDYRGELL
jgi:hypothetical protein